MKKLVLIISLISILFASCNNERSKDEEPQPKTPQPELPKFEFNPEVNAWYKTSDDIIYQVLSIDGETLEIRIYDSIKEQPICIATRSSSKNLIYDLEAFGSVYKCEVAPASSPVFQLELLGEKIDFEEPCDITNEVAKLK
ncbi:hypothetical protein [Flammeovirga pacifica]|uniref:Lipoprotein n=1 Tax=Flammeovirga pacifica TaxID=915059 RepID=A0A1S1Z094_FLAPC|nr:hypothetical protein [Flammeovirga pacifica]OHX66672.1 hypothetical protein NH26_10025 [Flammeovirga pacifica]